MTVDPVKDGGNWYQYCFNKHTLSATYPFKVNETVKIAGGGSGFDKEGLDGSLKSQVDVEVSGYVTVQNVENRVYVNAYVTNASINSTYPFSVAAEIAMSATLVDKNGTVMDKGETRWVAQISDKGTIPEYPNYAEKVVAPKGVPLGNYSVKVDVYCSIHADEGSAAGAEDFTKTATKISLSCSK
jgi:hypothetical protein